MRFFLLLCLLSLCVPLLALSSRHDSLSALRQRILDAADEHTQSSHESSSDASVDVDTEAGIDMGVAIGVDTVSMNGINLQVGTEYTTTAALIAAMATGCTGGKTILYHYTTAAVTKIITQGTAVAAVALSTIPTTDDIWIDVANLFKSDIANLNKWKVRDVPLNKWTGTPNEKKLATITEIIAALTTSQKYRGGSNAAHKAFLVPYYKQRNMFKANNDKQVYFTKIAPNHPKQHLIYNNFGPTYIADGAALSKMASTIAICVGNTYATQLLDTNRNNALLGSNDQQRWSDQWIIRSDKVISAANWWAVPSTGFIHWGPGPADGSAALKTEIAAGAASATFRSTFKLWDRTTWGAPNCQAHTVQLLLHPGI